MATPHRCPICNGTGTVPADFYGEPGTSLERVCCRGCYGSGIVWDYSVPYSVPDYFPPDYINWPPWTIS